MAEADIRTQIKAILDGVSNIGQTYDIVKEVHDEGTIISTFKATISSVDQIRFWMITREGANEKQKVIGLAATNGTEITHRYKIKGYQGLKDSSSTDQTLSTLAESIASAFRSNRTLNSTAFLHDGIQIETLSHITISGILCNYCELSLTVYQRV